MKEFTIEITETKKYLATVFAKDLDRLNEKVEMADFDRKLIENDSDYEILDCEEVEI